MADCVVRDNVVKPTYRISWKNEVYELSNSQEDAKEPAEVIGLFED